MKRRMAVEGELKKMEDKGKRSMNLQNFPKARKVMLFFRRYSDYCSFLLDSSLCCISQKFMDPSFGPIFRDASCYDYYCHTAL